VRAAVSAMVRVRLESGPRLGLGLGFGLGLGLGLGLGPGLGLGLHLDAVVLEVLAEKMPGKDLRVRR